jgi:CheY-like chemotaxis protein
VRCDANQLENALLNLAIDARDAMPDGGTLRIETMNEVFDEHQACQRDLNAGEFVCVRVSDTGSGMTPEVIAHAVDPFFTKKPIGQADAVETPEQPSQSVHRAGEDGVVLVVEDEFFIRCLIVEVLDNLGYRALEAADGIAGLEILKSPQRIELLVCDIGLPGLNGRQLADAARVTRPDLKVLFITGYAETAAGSSFLEEGMEIISKPFMMDAPAAKLQEMVEGGPRK